MEITHAGWLILMFAFICFIANKDMLYYATIFTIPFTGMAVINYPNYKLSIIAFTFLGIIWLIRVLIFNYILGRNKIYYLSHPIIVFLLLFLLAISISLSVPLIYDSEITYHGSGLMDKSKIYYLKFSVWHLIHLGYVLFGVIFVILSVNTYNTYTQQRNILKAYIYGVSTVALLGLLEVSLFYLNISVPFQYLNNLADTDVSGTWIGRQDIDRGLIRISSLSYEPSVFGVHVVTMLALLFVSYKYKYIIFSRKTDLILIVICFLAAILSLSTTAYAGIVGIFLIITTYDLCVRFKINYRLLLLTVFALLFGILAYLFSAKMQEAVMFYFLKKHETGSFQERFSTVLQAWDMFLEYPLTGLGWGVIPSFDLIVKILNGAGLLGLTSFMGFVIYVAYESIKLHIAQKNLNTIILPSTALATAFFTLLLMYEGNGFHYQYGDMWIIVILIMFARIRIKRPSPTVAAQIN